MDDRFSQLTHLTPEDRDLLRAAATTVPLLPRQVIVRQGQRPSGLILIAAGRVAVRRAAQDGAAAIDVAVLGPGDLIGEMSYCSGDAANADVVGVEPGALLRISAEALDRLTVEDPGLGQRLYRSLAKSLAGRLRDTTARLPALITEEVAQLQRRRGPLCGHLGEGAVPAPLCEAIDSLKEGLLHLDRCLAQATGSGSWALGPSDAAAMAAARCDQLLQALEGAILAAPDERTAEGLGAYTLRETFSFFMRSRFADRAFCKPRGFAGDYYTMEIIQEDQPTGDGRLGPLLDAWFLRRPAARSLRARRPFLSNMLLDRFRRFGTGADDSYRVLSLGSGAARELLDLFAALGRARSRCVRVTCLDIDMEALAFSNHLAHGLGVAERFQWTQENVLLLGEGRGHTRPAPQDVIYSDGLFDYLSDEQAVQVLSWAHAHLEPRGLLCLAGFDAACPDRTLLSHLLDWRLRYRSEAELTDLLRRSAFGEAAITTQRDETGASLFLLADRGG